ncbi:MAG: hypothetical protein KAJ06_09240, partial [Gammaproteobacteria bacterium]|nr:hypothetical protein [Gammaproteobacteria bacterium]
MSELAKFQEAAISLPSLLPLQAAPQDESQVVNYLQSLHNYLAQDRAKVVRALNVLSFYRLLMEDESEFPEPMGSGTLMVDTEADGLFYDADTGELSGAEWRPIIPPFVKVTKEPTGFIDTNQDSVLDIDTTTWPGEVHLTIEPTGASFSFYVAGEKFTKAALEHIQITTTVGLHHVYYDNTGTLVHDTSVSLEDIIRDNAYVALLYSNGTTIQGLMDERHGLLPWQAHLWMHLTTGTIRRSGLGITNLVVDQNGTADSHAECGGASGEIIDEDIPVDVGTLSVGADKWYTLHKSGATGVWNYIERSFAPIIPAGGAVPQYNEWTGATWQLTNVSNNYYFLMHIFAAPFITNGIGSSVEQYV